MVEIEMVHTLFVRHVGSRDELWDILDGLKREYGLEKAGPLSVDVVEVYTEEDGVLAGVVEGLKRAGIKVEDVVHRVLQDEPSRGTLIEMLQDRSLVWYGYGWSASRRDDFCRVSLRCLRSRWYLLRAAFWLTLEIWREAWRHGEA